jgi:hypothetical protein
MMSAPLTARVFGGMPGTRAFHAMNRRAFICGGPEAISCILNQVAFNRQSGVFGFCCKVFSYKNGQKSIASGFDEVILDRKANQFGVVAQIELF